MAEANSQPFYTVTPPYSPYPYPPPWGGPWWPPMPGPTIPTGPWLPPVTRGAVPTPLNPNDFNVPPAPVPGTSVGPLQPPVAPPATLSPAERDILKVALGVLREGRAAAASGAANPLESHRMIAAFAYLAGFLEARGVGQLGSFLATIPASATSSGADLDRFILQTESLLDGTADTRMAPAAIAGWILIGAAGNAVWEGAKWVYNKVT